MTLRVLHDAQEPLQKHTFPPLVHARSVVEQPLDVYEQPIRSVQRNRIRIESVDICRTQERT